MLLLDLHIGYPRPTIKTFANRRLAQLRVTWLIEHSALHQLLWCNASLGLRNPPLRQAPKRQAVKKLIADTETFVYQSEGKSNK
jgi:hypothetical protein